MKTEPTTRKLRRPPSGLAAAWAIATKDLNILRSDKMAVIGLLGMPLLFATFFGTIFGGSSSGPAQAMQVAVINEFEDDAAREFVQRLKDNGGIEVELLERSAAENAVRKGKKTAVLEILEVPDTAGLLSGERLRIRIGTDPGQQSTRGILEGMLSRASFERIAEDFADPDAMRGSIDQLSTSLEADEDVPFAQRILLKSMFGSARRLMDDVDKLNDPDAADDPEATGDDGGLANSFAPDFVFENVTREGRKKISSYEISFPQAMAWALMSGAAALALTLVKERRAGTLLRLRTSPIGGATILLGKTLACATTGIFVLAFLLVFGALTFGVRVPDPLTLGLAVVVCALSFAAMGTFMATLGRTEESVSGVSWGILMVIAMLGGGMVPTMFMPTWMKTASVVSPVRWAIHSLEGAIWRGYSVGEMASSLGVLIGFGAVFATLGWARMRHLRA